MSPHVQNQKRKRNDRRGAAAVEFAMVAPIFFVAVFACMDFSRFWIAESFVESTAFRVAREVSVFGATMDEALDLSQQELSVIGIEEFALMVVARSHGEVQSAVDDATTDVSVTIEIPAKERALLTRYFRNRSLTRDAVTRTNRP